MLITVGAQSRRSQQPPQSARLHRAQRVRAGPRATTRRCRDGAGAQDNYLEALERASAEEMFDEAADWLYALRVVRTWYDTSYRDEQRPLHKPYAHMPTEHSPPCLPIPASWPYTRWSMRERPLKRFSGLTGGDGRQSSAPNLLTS
jgi:hypothetical protein